MEQKKSDRLLALMATVAVHAAVLLALWLIVMQTPDSNVLQPRVTESELTVAGQYVKMGQIPYPKSKAPANMAEPQTADDPVVNDGSGDPEPATALVNSREESPMAVAEEEPAPKSGLTEEQEEARRRVAERTSRMNFSNRTASSSSAAGNTPTAGPGHTLDGRTLVYYEAPAKRTLGGSVVVSVTVNRDGIVTSARATGGNPPAASDLAARRACEAASRASRFSSSNSAPTSQSGTMTWTFQ